MNIIVIKQTTYIKGAEENLFYIKEIGKPFTIQKDELNVDGAKMIISFNFENLIHHIEIEKNVHYFDLEKVKKQITGRSKKEFKKNDFPWNIWNAIYSLNYQEFCTSKNEFEDKVRTAKEFFYGNNSGELDIANQVPFLLDCLEKLYFDISEELSNSIEFARYINIEKKLHNILLRTTKKGIAFDIEIVKKHIAEIETELYKFRNELQLDYGIFSKYDYRNLENNLINFIPKSLKYNSKGFWKYLKLKRGKHPLFDLLLNERKLSKNKTILTRIGSLLDNTIYPYFDYFGTITSRILVISPSLQQLNKKYRDIIVPADGKCLLYFDYSQFEAGLLASKADDDNLIKMYESDIYHGIVKSIGDDKITRDEAKQFFYSYCYGVERQNVTNDFFRQFPNLILYENLVSKEFEQNGYIETEFGNRRYRTMGIESINDEKWLISQKIQGLASIILKKVIISINENYPEVDFLLPMHDAILYQVNQVDVEKYQKELSYIFESVMKEYCEKLTPKVILKDFTK
ncbi:MULTISPECIES: DNA polymerase [Chryseobacterium]|uniref:DNA-directed DNA polymerase n=2 Tax=Chryseobacterium TaxID=59732 RepID=A0A543EJH8_9FLAO|nr:MULTISPECIES: DNA polymerase [Chryseobacterium]MDR6458197.1 DNA polymerase I-like protein with 3'-5' exonuclease and polymerase domains [Chryseobacterium vietnamense]TQM21745.1 DNA polymerase family A [Chryseobacterium aquifrigidense]